MSTCFVFSDCISPKSNVWEPIENELLDAINGEIVLFNSNQLDRHCQKYLKKMGFGLVSVKALAVDEQSPITKPEWNVTKNKTIRHKLVENTSMSCSKTVLVYGNRNNHLPTISGDNVKKIYDSINIASGCKGLGAELSISYPLSIEYEGENYKSAYEIFVNRTKTKEYFEECRCQNIDCWLEHLMHIKFLQHPSLVREITSMGGAEWTSRCSHLPLKSSRWAGIGAKSRYITCLTLAYSSAWFDTKKKNRAVVVRTV